MGNTIRSKKSTKVMKISGETIKFKSPVTAEEVARNHPGLVVIDSEMVKHYGVRAKPMEPHQELDPNRLYFLVEMPEVVRQGRDPRRVRSAITMSAKDRLERLMLARRSVSDLAIVNPNIDGSSSNGGGDAGVLEPEKRRVKVRLRKGEVERVMRESKDEAEAGEKIMNLYIEAKSKNGERGELGHEDDEEEETKQVRGGRRDEPNSTKREKRVSFLSSMGGALEVSVAS